MSWTYFWPSFAAAASVLVILLVITLCFNLMLGLVVFALYNICPKDVLFDRIVGLFRNLEIEEHLKDTFQIRVKHELPTTALYVWQPHGLLSITSVLYNSGILTNPTFKQTHGALLSFCHYIPVMGDIVRYMNSIPSDASSIRKALNAHESVSVMVGGVRDMLDSQPHIITIPKRNGVFRIALQTGTPVVPVLTYGENERFPPAKQWLTDAINEWLYKHFHFAFPFPSWTALQNWSELSYKSIKPIHSYTGTPIHVEKNENPTDADIDKVRTAYIRAVQELFKETAPPEYSLVVL